jgi:hypothetical protein
VATLRVLFAVWRERRRQIKKGYTREHDDHHGYIDFRNYMHKRVDPPAGAPDRQEFVEIAALAVAATEKMDRGKR